MEVPEPIWQGWTWQHGASLVLQADHGSCLPGLISITTPEPEACRLMIAARPMYVRRFAPGDPAWRGRDYAAEVEGFLDDSTSFLARVRSLTADERDSLLAALTTLKPDNT